MRTTSHRMGLVAGGAAVLLLAITGCSSNSTSGSNGSGDSTKGVRVAYAGDLDPNDIADQLGITAAGAKVTSLNDDNNVVNAVQKGTFEFGNVDTTSAIKAIQAGIPIKIVYVSQKMPEFVMISQPGISSLTQLAGKTVAYDSEGSETETLEKELAQQSDPTLVKSVKWTSLANSPNRAAAMVAHRLDATTVEYADLLAIQKKAKFNVLGNWTDLKGQSSDALATVWIASTKYLDANKGTATAFLKDVQTGYDKAYSDRAAWLALATKTLPSVNAADLGKTYDYYTKSDMYPKSGTAPITKSSWAGLDEFFRQNGEYKKKAPLNQMVDLTLLDAVNG